jgi:hypothetical protein
MNNAASSGLQHNGTHCSAGGQCKRRTRRRHSAQVTAAPGACILGELHSCGSSRSLQLVCSVADTVN